MDPNSKPLDPEEIPLPNIGKKLFFAAIGFLFWLSWYVMHAPEGFIE